LGYQFPERFSTPECAPEPAPEWQPMVGPDSAFQDPSFPGLSSSHLPSFRPLTGMSQADADYFRECHQYYSAPSVPPSWFANRFPPAPPNMTSKPFLVNTKILPATVYINNTKVHLVGDSIFKHYYEDKQQLHSVENGQSLAGGRTVSQLFDMFYKPREARPFRPQAEHVILMLGTVDTFHASGAWTNKNHLRPHKNVHKDTDKFDRYIRPLYNGIVYHILTSPDVRCLYLCTIMPALIYLKWPHTTPGYKTLFRHLNNMIREIADDPRWLGRVVLVDLVSRFWNDHRSKVCKQFYNERDWLHLNRLGFQQLDFAFQAVIPHNHVTPDSLSFGPQSKYIRHN
jgi:hypothetical protein